MKNKLLSSSLPLMLKALAFFMNNPYQEIYLREYGRLLAISPNSAQRFLDTFVQEGFISESRRGHLRYFKANIESPVFRSAKITFSLFDLQKAGLFELLKEASATHVILFGSVAAGTDDASSDLDIAIIASDKLRVQRALDVARKKVSRELNAYVFSWAEWKEQEKTNKAFYRDIVTKGVALIGEKPVIS